ncbi:Serine Palmitoyltransferase 1 [Manis pentadactyla]|nr:Serine Palmitoyltransferase 1 [Manis pentadactyla]
MTRWSSGRRSERLGKTTVAEPWVLVELVQAFYEDPFSPRLLCCEAHPLNMTSPDMCTADVSPLDVLWEPHRDI